MNNAICISTGLVYKFTNDRNIMIKILKEYNPDGVELSFAYPEYLSRFILKRENKEYLKTLKFNSIHAPFKDIKYGSNKQSNETIKLIKDLYHEINAKNVVFHDRFIEDYKIIEDVADDGINVSLENDDWKEGCNTVDKVERILSEYPKIKFTFDFAHAFSISPNDIKEYIRLFKEKIIQVHLSLLTKKMKTHGFIYKYDNEKNRILIKSLNKLNVPFVLESVAQRKGDIKAIKMEMEYIRSILKTKI